MKVIEKTIYHFDELSDKAKETARASFRDLDYIWLDDFILGNEYEFYENGKLF